MKTRFDGFDGPEPHPSSSKEWDDWYEKGAALQKATPDLLRVACELAEKLEALMPHAELYLRQSPGADFGYMLDVYVTEAKSTLVAFHALVDPKP